MKQGKRPTKKQSITISNYGLNHRNWLIVKNLPEELHISHRDTGKVRVLPNF